MTSPHKAPLSLAAYILCLPIRAYRALISPLLGPRCRFVPSCSAYALEALTRHGAIKGAFLTLRRLLRCHPFSRTHGHDPVPQTFAWREVLGYKASHDSQRPPP